MFPVLRFLATPPPRTNARELFDLISRWSAQHNYDLVIEMRERGDGLVVEIPVGWLQDPQGGATQALVSLRDRTGEFEGYSVSLDVAIERDDNLNPGKSLIKCRPDLLAMLAGCGISLEITLY